MMDDVKTTRNPFKVKASREKTLFPPVIPLMEPSDPLRRDLSPLHKTSFISLTQKHTSSLLCLNIMYSLIQPRSAEFCGESTLKTRQSQLK